MSCDNVILQLERIEKTFAEPTGPLKVINGISLDLRRGEITLLQGPSGSGKTTLLQIAGAMLRADAGRVRIAGTEINTADATKRTIARREHLGFLFQQFHLVDALTVRDNVLLGVRLKRQSLDNGHVTRLLEELGLGSKQEKMPSELSGGEKQRVALARALAPQPIVLLADEPTSQLDAHTAEVVANLVRSRVKHAGVAVLIATHDARLQTIGDRMMRLSNGKLYE